jgi:ArsR family transcriptional regulator, arsenate/arsenite/antimonite-responsive transcriptional repressor
MNNWRELKMMIKALTGVARLTIVYHLAHHDEITVTELTDMLGLSQPLVSWHLRKLRRAGFIGTRRIGRQVYCFLDKTFYRDFLQQLETLIDPAIQVEAFPFGDTLLEAEAIADE